MKSKHTLPAAAIKKILGIAGPKNGFAVKVLLDDGSTVIVRFDPGKPINLEHEKGKSNDA